MLRFCLRYGCNAQNDADEDDGSGCKVITEGYKIPSLKQPSRILTNRELDSPMSLEPITHERSGIPRKQCPRGEEEQEPKDAKHSVSNDQLLIWLEWDRTGARGRTPIGGRTPRSRANLLGQIE